MRVAVYFSPIDRQVHLPQKFCNEALLPQGALVCEERNFELRHYQVLACVAPYTSSPKERLAAKVV